MPKSHLCLPTVLAAFLCPALIHAQATGTINGTVSTRPAHSFRAQPLPLRIPAQIKRDPRLPMIPATMLCRCSRLAVTLCAWRRTASLHSYRPN